MGFRIYKIWQRGAELLPGLIFAKINFFIFRDMVKSTVGHFRKFPALENFACWKFTRWKSVAGNAGKNEKF